MAAILQKIYTEVWEPVEQAFPVNTNRVIVSPDGQLNFLSFATLLDAEKGLRRRKILDTVRDERSRPVARDSADFEQAGHRDG